MVGWGKEDEQFALELTCNYGIDSYESGNDLRHIAVDSKAWKGPEEEVVVEKGEGGRERRFVVSPDGYKYLLVDTGSKEVPKEPFLFVSVHVADVEKSKKYYVDVLDANVRPSGPGGEGGKESVMVGFDKAGTGVCLELVQLPRGGKVDHALASGRFASETEDGAPDKVGARVKKAGGEILHGPLKLQPHGEEVVIVADPDGYEFCFVDARGYTNCINVREAAEGTTVDWPYREKLEKAARSGENAKLAVAKVLAGDYDVKRIKGMMDELLKAHPVVVFAQVTCPFCAKAKALLKEVGAKFEVVEVDAMEGKDGFAVRVELDKITGRSTVSFGKGGREGRRVGLYMCIYNLSTDFCELLTHPFYSSLPSLPPSPYRSPTFSSPASPWVVSRTGSSSCTRKESWCPC
jgi:glutaredoxin